MHTDLSAGLSSGWQTLFADLSIILFMVTASAVKEAPAKPPLPPLEASLKDDAVPIAVWRDGAGAEPLPQWMAVQSADPRVSFSVIIRYPKEQLQQATARALAIAGSGKAKVRIVLERGSASATMVVASFENVTAETTYQRDSQ